VFYYYCIQRGKTPKAEELFNTVECGTFVQRVLSLSLTRRIPPIPKRVLVFMFVGDERGALQHVTNVFLLNKADAHQREGKCGSR
jgi:hypothetical protein